MKVKVYLLEFFTPCNTHTEIVLETTRNGEKYYYGFNRWSIADNKFTSPNYDCEDAIKQANRTAVFEIDANLADLINDCKEHLNSREGSFFTNNCGDASAWFLAKYGDIKNPGACGKPVTCNQSWCCFFVPSFAQGCLPTLPGRVMDYTEHQLKLRDETDQASPPKLHME